MRKSIILTSFCVFLLLLLSAVSFASMHGLFEGYPIVKVIVDGKEIKGDVPAINFKGRTMVPVRFVSEALGADIAWDAEKETAVITTNVAGTPTPIKPAPAPAKNEHTVKDSSGKVLYSFKLNEVTEMTERNRFSDKKPAQVLLIDYTYTNIANKEDLYLGDISFKIVDSAGKIGYTYPNTPTNYPQSIPQGVTCHAQMIFGIDSKSDSVKIYFYENLFGEATATFEMPVK
ncbi:MAG: copper amine oxidase N-terminal domain-containing protein [Firmicutes bacterium]|nr:copper amine oxidase N-terminal domain-containing protein [Bacillota bacterium]